MPICEDLAEKLGLRIVVFTVKEGCCVNVCCCNTCNASSCPAPGFYKHILELLSAVGLKLDVKLHEKINAIY